MYRTLKLDSKNGIATVTLNRPEARNAMSARLMREMIACAGRVGTMRDVDVVIVRGSGVCFSAGADLKDSSRWGNGELHLIVRHVACRVRADIRVGVHRFLGHAHRIAGQGEDLLRHRARGGERLALRHGVVHQAHRQRLGGRDPFAQNAQAFRARWRWASWTMPRRRARRSRRHAR